MNIKSLIESTAQTKELIVYHTIEKMNAFGMIDRHLSETHLNSNSAFQPMDFDSVLHACNTHPKKRARNCLVNEHEMSNAAEDADTRSNQTVSYDDETVIWESSPSQWINLGNHLFWGLCLIGSIILLLVWTENFKTQFDPMIQSIVSWGCVTLFSVSVLNIVYAFLAIHYERTVITKNKIKESKGITKLFQRDLYCEISDIEDTQSPPAGLMALFGLSTLIILTKDDDQPVIKIRAIRNRDTLINTLLPIWRPLKIERKGYFGN